MASRNRVELIGNLGADPEVRYLPNGDAVANLRLATSEEYKDSQSGELKEITEWHRVVLYRKQAELANSYLKKGSQILIEGKLRTRKWKDKSGVERYNTEIEGRELMFLGGPRGKSSSTQSEERQVPTNDRQSKPAFDGVDAPF